MGQVAGENVEAVALAGKPLLALDRLLSSALAGAPSAFPRFAAEARPLLPYLFLGPRLRAKLGVTAPLLFVDRLECLGAAAQLHAAVDEAALLVAGGAGEWADCALGVCAPDGPRLDAELPYPHGFAQLWASAARGSDWRALAPRGAPSLLDALRRELFDLKEDGSLRLDTGYLETPARMDAVLAGASPEDAAASLRALTVETLARMAAEARRRAGRAPLVLAGDAALDGTAALSSGGPVYACPLPSGPAAALGAAALAWRRALQAGWPSIGDAPPLASLPAPAVRPERDAALGALLRLVYYSALTPYSLVFRLLGVSFLDERFEAVGTYWRPRRLEGEGVRALRRRF